MLVDGYTSLAPHNVIEIEALFSVHYFEYTSTYIFPGEQHNFWELCCVDKGEILVRAGDADHRLRRGEVIFHKPGEFHDVRANGEVAPNFVVVSFACHSPAMAWFEGRTLSMSGTARELLARLIREARAAFVAPLDAPRVKELTLRADAPVGAEQMIRCCLEALLLELLREGAAGSPADEPDNVLQRQGRQQIFEQVCRYLEANLDRKLTLSDICRESGMGRSQLQSIFRQVTGGGVMDYFGKMRTEAAKSMIRAGARSFTEIADRLGYSSVHYFSRHFKNNTGMTPSEYAQSVKALSERHTPPE